METLLSFLTVRLKENGMTVNELCGRIGISRQKFYRFVKEPQRFPAETVRALVRVLSLDDKEAAQLDSYFRPQENREYAPDLSDYSGLIENIFRHKPSAEVIPDLDTIEYTQEGRHTTKESPVSLARILSGLYEDAHWSGSAASAAKAHIPGAPGVSAPAVLSDHVPAAQTHEYVFTLFNCVPSIADYSEKRVISTTKSIQTVASIVKQLEDVMLPHADVKIRIRHYMTKKRRDQMRKDDLNDQAAMSFQLQLLDTLLPLLSMAEDYSIETADNPNTVWTSRGDLCLIRHTCRSSRDFFPASSVSSSPDQAVFTEYYSLMFSENGDCRACRLGSDEVSHIYRFLSPDGQGSAGHPETPAVDNPSREFFERFKECPIIMIYPDLSFDDIPPQIWITLYREIQNKDDRELYVKVFRRLIDPYDRYAFLSFNDLAQAVLQTMEQRSETGIAQGNSVICHPQGLLNLVRTGMITDLAVGSDGCTGSSRNSAPLRFPDPLIRELLEMIRSNILWRQSAKPDDPSKYNRVNYYILHPQFPLPEVIFYFYGGRGVIPLYTKGRHRHTIANIYDAPAAATILFDYVKYEMIGKRGEKLGSDILSDENSIALLDSLISMLKEP